MFGALLLSKCLEQGVFVDRDGRHDELKVFLTKCSLETTEGSIGRSEKTVDNLRVCEVVGGVLQACVESPNFRTLAVQKLRFQVRVGGGGGGPNW